MRTETITKTYAKFNELNTDKQSKVLDNLRDINVDYDWWGSDKYDFHAILEILGFYNIESEFTGFWSQGDGASFKAMFTVPHNNDKMKDRIAKLKEYAPLYFKNDRSLLNDLLDLDYQLSGYHDDLEVYRSGLRYSHEYTMQCDNDNLLNVARQLARRYYSDLNSQYEYLTSDEAIKETIEANDYEFDLDTLELA